MDAEGSGESASERDGSGAATDSTQPPIAGTQPATDASLIDVASAESATRTVGDVDLHVVTAGDPDDPLVVLLHGFPEFWYGWRHQIGPLVDAGYRVIVPDQRGYNLSDVPEELDAYRISELSADVAALVESEGRASAHVVGHDWGAAVAWDLALRRPEVVDRLCAANTPHPTAFRAILRSSPRQMARSLYAMFFQLPRLPEWLLARNDYALLCDGMVDTAPPGTFTDEALTAYRAAWKRAGTLSGMLNWYRAAARRPDRPPRVRVTQPTRVIWGDDDHALVPELAAESRSFCEDGDIQRFEGVSHWVHLERPAQVTAVILGHLGD